MPYNQDDTPRDTFARNWSYLYKNLTAAMASLEFDATKELMPSDKLMAAHACLRQIEERITQQKITRLGRLNIRSEIGFVINSINGLDQATKERTISDKRINLMLPPLVSKLKTVAVELTVRAEKEASEFAQSNVHARAAAVQTPAQIEAIAAKTKNKTKEQKSVGLHTNMQDAMQVFRENNAKQAQKEAERLKEERKNKEQEDENALLKAMERHKKEQQEFPGTVNQPEVPVHKRSRFYKPTKEEELEDAARNRQRLNVNWEFKPEQNGGTEVAPEEKDTLVIRDQKNITELRDTFLGDLAKMKAALKKAALHENTNLNYTLLRGPIAVITAPNASPRKQGLEHSGLSYTIVYTPNIRPSLGDNVKKEYTPPVIVFRDQVLVAFGTKPQPAKKKVDPAAKRLPIIRSKKSIESVTYTDADIDLIRADLCDIIGVKLGGGKWLDVLEANKGSTAKYITDKNFPHVRFVWFVKLSAYSRIGSFIIKSAGFPFSS